MRNVESGIGIISGGEGPHRLDCATAFFDPRADLFAGFADHPPEYGGGSGAFFAVHDDTGAGVGDSYLVQHQCFSGSSLAKAMKLDRVRSRGI